MAGAVEITLDGFKELAENLQGLDAALRTKIGFRAVMRVQRATRDDAIRIAHSKLEIGSGALLRNIAIARIKSVSPLAFIYDVGVRHGTKKQIKQTKAHRKNTGNASARGINDPWYWRLHEFGFHNRGGGEVGPRPFLTPAFEKRKSDGLSMMGETLWKGIEAANKPNKK